MATAATLSLPKSGTLGSALTITINNYDSTCKYSLSYLFGETSGTISVSSSSLSWTPDLKLAYEIPSNISGLCTLTLTTSDSSDTFVGRSNASITLLVPDSIVPTMSGLLTTRINNAVPSSWNAYVKGISQVKLEMVDPEGAYGSTITSYLIEGGGFASSTSELTTGILMSSGTVTFTATITDSRGRSNSYTANILVLDYEKPRFSEYKAQRCDSSGTVIEGGTYVLLHTIYSYSSLNGLNSISSSIKYKLTSASSWTTYYKEIISGDNVCFSGNIETNKNYEIELTLSDAFYSTTITLYIESEVITMDFANGGLSVAIGTTAEKEKVFELSSDWRFYYREYEILDILHPVNECVLRGSTIPRYMMMIGSWSKQGNSFTLGGNTYSIWKRTS